MIYAVRSNGASDPNHEPPIFQGSVLGRDHRIAVGGSRQEERCWRSACSRPGLERLPTRDSPHQRADKLVEINDRFLIIKVHERKDSPAQTMSSRTKNRRHRASRRTSWRPILRPVSAHRENRSTHGWCRNWL